MKTNVKVTISFFSVLFFSLQKLYGQHAEKTTDTHTEIPDRFVALSDSFSASCYFKGTTNSKVVALTFDDGPSEVSKKVVALLEQYNAKGTFFWLGEKVGSYHEFARRIANEHQLANHSWDHINQWEASNEDLWGSQVQKTNLEFERLDLPVPQYYRPPYGAVTKEQVAYLSEQQINTILWSLSTLDWDTSQNSTKEIFQRFVTGLHPGAIVLLHDRGFNDNGENMLAALQQILEYGTAEGYQFVTVQEIIEQS